MYLIEEIRPWLVHNHLSLVLHFLLTTDCIENFFFFLFLFHQKLKSATNTLACFALRRLSYRPLRACLLLIGQAGNFSLSYEQI